MTAAEIARLEALLEKATPGEWAFVPGGGHAHNQIEGAESVQIHGWRERKNGIGNASCSNRVCENFGDQNLDAPKANQELICAMKNALPELLKAARDVERYRKLKKIAVQKIAWDVYGNGGFWQVGVHSDDSCLSFDEAVDAMKEASRG